VVVRTWEAPAGDGEFMVTEEIVEGGTAWYAARCFGEADT
jgi:hypothetical protein